MPEWVDGRADVVCSHRLEAPRLTSVRIGCYLDDLRRTGSHVGSLGDAVQFLCPPGALAGYRRGSHLGARQSLSKSTVHDASTIVKCDRRVISNANFNFIRGAEWSIDTN